MKEHHHTMFGYKRLSSEDNVLTKLILTPRQTNGHSHYNIPPALLLGRAGSGIRGGDTNPSYISS